MARHGEPEAAPRDPALRKALSQLAESAWWAEPEGAAHTLVLCARVTKDLGSARPRKALSLVREFFGSEEQLALRACNVLDGELQRFEAEAKPSGSNGVFQATDLLRLLFRKVAKADKSSARSPSQQEPADAPDESPAWRRCTFKAHAGVALAEFDGVDGRKESITVSAKKAGNSPEEALRIARLCYLRLEQGACLEEVQEYRGELYERLGSRAAAHAGLQSFASAVVPRILEHLMRCRRLRAKCAADCVKPLFDLVFGAPVIHTVPAVVLDKFGSLASGETRDQEGALDYLYGVGYLVQWLLDHAESHPEDRLDTEVAAELRRLREGIARRFEARGTQFSNSTTDATSLEESRSQQPGEEGVAGGPNSQQEPSEASRPMRKAKRARWVSLERCRQGEDVAPPQPGVGLSAQGGGSSSSGCRAMPLPSSEEGGSVATNVEAGSVTALERREGANLNIDELQVRFYANELGYFSAIMTMVSAAQENVELLSCADDTAGAATQRATKSLGTISKTLLRLVQEANLTSLECQSLARQLVTCILDSMRLPSGARAALRPMMSAVLRSDIIKHAALELWEQFAASTPPSCQSPPSSAWMFGVGHMAYVIESNITRIDAGGCEEQEGCYRRLLVWVQSSARRHLIRSGTGAAASSKGELRAPPGYLEPAGGLGGQPLAGEVETSPVGEGDSDDGDGEDEGSSSIGTESSAAASELDSEDHGTDLEDFIDTAPEHNCWGFLSPVHDGDETPEKQCDFSLGPNVEQLRPKVKEYVLSSNRQDWQLRCRQLLQQFPPPDLEAGLGQPATKRPRC